MAEHEKPKPLKRNWPVRIGEVAVGLGLTVSFFFFVKSREGYKNEKVEKHIGACALQLKPEGHIALEPPEDCKRFGSSFDWVQLGTEDNPEPVVLLPPSSVFVTDHLADTESESQQWGAATGRALAMLMVTSGGIAYSWMREDRSIAESQ